MEKQPFQDVSDVSPIQKMVIFQLAIFSFQGGGWVSHIFSGPSPIFPPTLFYRVVKGGVP